MPPLPFLLIAIGLLAATACRGREADPPLIVERVIDFYGVAGRIDHLAVDLARHRLFVAEVDAGALELLDIQSGASLRRVTGLHEPQGVAYLPALDEVAVADGGDGTVRFFRADGLAPVGVVRVPGDADNLRILDKSGELVVADGEGLTLIDPSKGTVVGSVRLGAHPEGFQIDQATGRAYVNVPSLHRIAVVDLASKRQVGFWPTGLLFGNYPLALSGQEVASVFRAPGRLQVSDAASGRTISNNATCGDADDVHFDVARGQLYVTCGSGDVEVFSRGASGYRSIGRVRTRAGARTAVYVPQFDRLFVAAPAHGSSPAAVLVLRPQN